MWLMAVNRFSIRIAVPNYFGQLHKREKTLQYTFTCALRPHVLCEEPNGIRRKWILLSSYSVCWLMDHNVVIYLVLIGPFRGSLSSH